MELIPEDNAVTIFVVITAINGLLCFAGVCSRAFPDNLWQRIGLSILCITSWARTWALYQGEGITDIRAWIHVGIFCFAFGTWYKFALYDWLMAHPYYWNIFHFHGKRRTDPPEE